MQEYVWDRYSQYLHVVKAARAHYQDDDCYIHTYTHTQKTMDKAVDVCMLLCDRETNLRQAQYWDIPYNPRVDKGYLRYTRYM